MGIGRFEKQLSAGRQPSQEHRPAGDCRTLSFCQASHVCRSFIHLARACLPDPISSLLCCVLYLPCADPPADPCGGKGITGGLWLTIYCLPAENKKTYSLCIVTSA